MAGFFARRKFRNEVIARVNAMLLFYPGGVKNLARNYPNLGSAIDGNFDAGGISQGRSALLIAGSIISNEFEHLDPNDRDVIRRQLGKIDFEQFKRTLRGNGQRPQDIMGGTSLAALALVMAEIELKNGEVSEDDFKNFASEVSGALQGKGFAQRSYERTRDTMDEVLGPPPLRDGEDDASDVLPSQRYLGELPDFNGTECKVCITFTPTGFALIRKDDGVEIVERRSLTQKDIEKVPLEDWKDCRFVNLRTRSGEIVSCLIVGEESEVIGSKRAFWWALAKVTVRMTDVHAGDLRMSVHGLARVHAEARAMWDTVIERSSSIEQLREEPMYARSIHYDVISNMIKKAESEAGKLGLEICRAMVLATQSEDAALEAFAFERFKRFLWRPGEEPQEFYAPE
ncbi:MAG: hypothetical protein ABSG88_16115 [Bradyrhizobium sp.]